MTQLDFTALRHAAQREIDKGLVACQVAVARDGDVVWTESFGDADDQSRFRVASATKPIVASAVWLLIGDGLLDVTRPVAHYLPEFAANGKGQITVEQVLLMIAGFPSATMSLDDGADPERRRARMAAWEIEYEPGTKYVYHATSSHWVQAELIERLSGTDFRDFVEQRVTTPLGLPRVLGIPRDEQQNILGIDRAVVELPPDAVTIFRDSPRMVEVGVPGGGGAMSATTLARFYQGLLNNPGGIWKPDVLRDATTNIRCTLPDPMFGMPANRTLGVVIGNGFGVTWGASDTAFGWPGAGGQIGFAEPANGISFAFLQHGDPDMNHTFGRSAKLSNLGLALGQPEDC